MANSPQRTPKSPGKSPGRGGPENSDSPTKLTRKEVTRYGPVKETQPKFGTEERFMWQKALGSSDCVYELPEMTSSKSVVFGSSLRGGMDDNPDRAKNSTGPGSYNPGESYDYNSEYITKSGNRFACAARASMAVKTPSPGPVYNIENCFWNGPIKNQGIGFANSVRQPLYGSTDTANADMFMPKVESGTSITIAKKFKGVKNSSAATPGPIYNVSSVLLLLHIDDTTALFHNNLLTSFCFSSFLCLFSIFQDPRTFQTGPKFSFGAGKSDRFKHAGQLSDLGFPT